MDGLWTAWCAENPEIYGLLKLCGEIAGNRWRVYAVGGMVRDVLLRLSSRDVDIVVERGGPEYARALAERLGGSIAVHEQFGTATVTGPLGLTLDIVQARRETYAYPGALPKVEWGSLLEDLRRRDFTANSLAIALNEDSWGQLCDAGCGYEDLQSGIMRIWHKDSFVDDPTRMFRAAKYAARCGWKLEENTVEELKKAVESGALQTVSAGRLRRELELILQEERPGEGLEFLYSWGLLQAMDWMGCWPCVKRRLDALDDIRGKFTHLDLSQVVLNVMFAPEVASGKEWLQRWNFSAERCEEYWHWVKAWQKMDYYSDKSYTRAERAYLLPQSENVLASLLCWGDDSELSELIDLYLLEWRAMELYLNGRDLKRLGIPPGSVYKEILQRLWIAQADKTVCSLAEAEELALRVWRERAFLSGVETPSL